MQHWDSYWQNTKTLNSFAEGEQGLGYSGAIAEFWHTVFASLSDNARLLDLATGNGGLALLALQANSSFQVSASDKANIAPLQLFNKQDSSYPYLKKIQFFGNMASEQLTFSDEAFELVTSQFGFEYAQPEPTLQQIHRVLSPGGKMVALVHHEQSFISEDCKVGLPVLDFFIGDNGLLPQAKEFASTCQQLQQFAELSFQQQQLLKQQSNKLLASFMSVQRQCHSNQLDWFNDVAKDLIPLLGNWQSLTVEVIDKLWLSLTHFSQRITDQLTATWDSNQIKLIKQLAVEQGFSVSYSTLDTKFGKLCWVFEATK